MFLTITDTNLEGTIIEVSLAKPVDKSDYVRYTRGIGSKTSLPEVGCLNDDSLWTESSSFCIISSSGALFFVDILGLCELIITVAQI
jgi:hypothetical protein